MKPTENSRLPWTILVSTWLLAFSMWTPMFCIPPMEHILKDELALTHAQTSLLFTAPILMIIAASIPAGLLADRIGVKKAAGIGAIIMTLGAILKATSTDPSSILAFTFLYGVGLAWSFTNLPKVVSLWVPPQRAGVATGLYSVGIFAGSGLPLAITMSIIFPMTNSFQGVFLFWNIPPIIATATWWLLVKEPQQSSIHNKSVTKNTISLRRVLRNKNLWLVASFFILSNFFVFNWSAWAPSLLLLKGATPDSAGIFSSLFFWAAIPAAFLVPRLAYRIGLRKPFLWVPGIILSFMSWWAVYANLTISWLIMVIVGIAHNTRFMSIMTLPVEIMPKEEVGVATGFINSIGFIGGVIGPLVGGLVLDYTSSLDTSLLVLVGLSVAAAVVGLKLPETGPKGH